MKKNLVLLCLAVTVLASMGACKKKEKCNPHTYNTSFVSPDSSANKIAYVDVVAYKNDSTFSVAIDSVKGIHLTQNGIGNASFCVTDVCKQFLWAQDWKVTAFPSGRVFKISGIVLDDNIPHALQKQVCVGDNLSIEYMQNDTAYATPLNGGSKYLTLNIHLLSTFVK